MTDRRSYGAPKVKTLAGEVMEAVPFISTHSYECLL